MTDWTTTPEMQAELRRLLDAATPGPWSSHDHGFPGQDEPSSIVIYSGERFDWEEVTHGESAVAWTGWDSQEASDAALIVAAVNALPALLDAAAERDRLAGLLDEPRRSGCAVEIAGVRIAPCDERGQTADMCALAAAADRLAHMREARDNSRAEVERLTDERDALAAAIEHVRALDGGAES